MRNHNGALNRVCRVFLLPLLWCLGIRILLPEFLDTPSSTLLLGIAPPLLLYLVVRCVLKRSSHWRVWAAPVTGAALSILVVVLISPPPFGLLVVAVVAGTVSRFFETKRISVPVLTAVLVASNLLSPTLDRKIEGPRLLILGIDAMDYNVVTDLLENGLLPVLRKLTESGAFGPLETESPTFSPILWTTIASGKGPESHNVKGFYSTSEHVEVPRIWDILEEKGWCVGLFRWLVTWPPKETASGFWIPDFLARDDSAHPPEYGVINEFRGVIKNRLIDGEKDLSPRDIGRFAWSFLRLGIRGSTLLSLGSAVIPLAENLFRDTSQYYIFMRRVEMAINGDLFLHLLKSHQPDLAVFYDNSIDMIGHRYWKYTGTDRHDLPDAVIERYGTEVPRIYEWTDRTIGRILHEISPSCHVVLLSDHGQKGIEEEAMNAWVVKGDNVLRALGLEYAAYVMTLGSFSYLFPVRQGKGNSVKETVARELIRIRLLEGNQPLLVVRTDSSTDIPYLDIDEINLTGNERITLDDEIVPLAQFITRYFTQTGDHDRYGVLFLAGPGVQANTSLHGAKLRDIVPTLLYWEGLPIGRDMEGRVLASTFETNEVIRYIESYDRGTPPVKLEDVDIDPEVKRKLRTLGYVN